MKNIIMFYYKASKHCCKFGKGYGSRSINIHT